MTDDMKEALTEPFAEPFPEPFGEEAKGWKPYWDQLGLGPLWVRRNVPDPFADDVPGFERVPPVRNAMAAQSAQATAPGGSPVPQVAAGTVGVGGVGAGPRPEFARTAPPRRPGPPEELQRRTARPVAGMPGQDAQSAQPAQPAQPAGAKLAPEIAAEIPTADWKRLCELANGCRACPMAASRQHVVFSDGEPGPKLVVVGEAPGSEEDLQGKPFVGKSGQLLTAMLDAIGVVRGEDAVILNTLKCRPFQNRDPLPDELQACEAFLRRQLEILAPDVVFVIGRFAAKSMLPEMGDAPLGRMRGAVHAMTVAGKKVPVVVSYHPSYLLRSPDAKAKAWEDLVLLRRTCREAGMAFPDRSRRAKA